VAIGPDNALIMQSDCSVLLDVHAPRAAEARAALVPQTPAETARVFRGLRGLNLVRDSF
jgi:hypothetical protein